MNRNITALILYSIFWVSFLTLSGTLTSGYHLSDDHEAVTFRVYMNDNGFIKTYEKAMKEDLVMRFRPFYYLHRVTLVALFGTNFLFWSIHNSILAIITSYLLFLFLFRQGFSFWGSLIFPFLILIGSQTAIWWRLGPNETIGMFLYSLSLFLLVNSIRKRKKYQLAISVFCLFLASLSKESFLIIIPAYLIILVYIEFQNNSESQSVYKILIRNIPVFSVCILFLISVLYIIVRYVGTNSIGYAGVDKTTSIASYLSFIFSDLGRNKYVKLLYWGFGLLVLSILLIKKDKTSVKKRFPIYLLITMIFLSITIPQYILYFKSGLWERYLIPLTLGFSLLIIFMAEEISKQSKIIYGLYLLIILMAVIRFFRSDTIDPAKNFAKVGKDTNKFFSTIISNTSNKDTILMVLDVISGYEWGFSCQAYLKANDRENIRFYMYHIAPADAVEAGTKMRFLNYFEPQMADTIKNSYPCIAIIPFKEQNKIIQTIDGLYDKHEIADFTVFTVKSE